MQLLLVLCCLLVISPTDAPSSSPQRARVVSQPFRDWRYARRGRALSPKQSRPDQDSAPSCLWTFSSAGQCVYRLYWYEGCDDCRRALANLLKEDGVEGWTVLRLEIDNRKGRKVIDYSPELNTVTLLYRDAPDGPLKRVESEDVSRRVSIALCERTAAAPYDEEAESSLKKAERAWEERLSTKAVLPGSRTSVFVIFKTEIPVSEKKIEGVWFTDGPVTIEMRKIVRDRSGQGGER